MRDDSTSVLPAAAAKKNEETTPTVPTEQTECSKNPNAYAIYPLPQKVTYPQTTQSFELKSGEVTIVAENGVDEATKNFVKKVLDKYKLDIKNLRT